MVIGSGLLATIFNKIYLDASNVCIFASGVSDSTCEDITEFEREKRLLVKTFERNQNVNSFVYFSTCSIEDLDRRSTPYVKHKLEMESIVLKHPQSLVFRLPQVVGFGGNSKTLMNFLYQSIKSGNKFELWKNASRNIIDIDDVVSIVSFYIANVIVRQNVLNIANPINYTMIEIVNSMEKILEKKGIYEVTEKGETYCIDISEISSIIKETDVFFDQNYLQRIIKKYFAII